MRLRNRVEVLEKRDGGDFIPFVRVIQHEGQTEEEAAAAHEAEHGPLGDRARILRVIIRSPNVQDALA